MRSHAFLSSRDQSLGSSTALRIFLMFVGLYEKNRSFDGLNVTPRKHEPHIFAVSRALI